MAEGVGRWGTHGTVEACMVGFWKGVKGIVWDWGDTLMRDLPGQAGPMAQWPYVEAMPGVAEALESLSHIPVQCLATNAQDSQPEDVAAALERVGLRSYLTLIFVSPELGFAKPDPRFFQEVARRLGISPGGLVSVGNDYAKDIVPAKAVGMKTVLVKAEAISAGSDSDGADSGKVPAADLVVKGLGPLARISSSP